MNGYKLNNILGWQLISLGFAIGLIFSQFDISMDALVVLILIIAVSISLVSFVLWKKIAPFEQKLREIKV